MTDLDTLAWDALGHMPGADIPLLDTALLIARDEYPALDIAAYATAWRGEQERLAARIAPDADVPARLAALNRFLYEELGFAGNDRDYYDPRNSYINDVLDRRLGIPLSLGMLQLSLAQRIGVGLEGVSFPGHFLLRLPMEGGLIVLDPYNGGRALSKDELLERARAHLGGRTPDDAQLLDILEPADPRDMLSRMLRNLRGVHLERKAPDKALRAAHRLVCLNPDDAGCLRNRGQLYLQLGHVQAGRHDLLAYLQARPEAEDADDVRAALLDTGSQRARLH